MRGTRRPANQNGWSALEAEAAALFASLHLPDKFTLGDIQARIEQRRKRRLLLLGRPMPAAGLHGLWIGSPDTDYLFFNSGTSPVHRLAIIGHELCHILRNEGTLEALTRTAARLLPDLDPSVVENAAARTDYGQELERRAEAFSTLVITRLTNWSTFALRLAEPAVLARITAALEEPERG